VLRLQKPLVHRVLMVTMHRVLALWYRAPLASGLPWSSGWPRRRRRLLRCCSAAAETAFAIMRYPQRLRAVWDCEKEGGMPPRRWRHPPGRRPERPRENAAQGRHGSRPRARQRPKPARPNTNVLPSARRPMETRRPRSHGCSESLETLRAVATVCQARRQRADRLERNTDPAVPAATLWPWRQAPAAHAISPGDRRPGICRLCRRPAAAVNVR
jgi:hypothetical protein